MNTSDIGTLCLQCVLVRRVCMSGEGLAWTQHSDVVATIHFVHRTAWASCRSMVCLLYPERCTVTGKRLRPESPILHHTTHHGVDIPTASRGHQTRSPFLSASSPPPYAPCLRIVSSAAKKEGFISPANILFVNLNTRKKNT